MAVILHVDLDAFFASCEKRRNSDLEESPVVVCVYSGRGKDSGAVSAADYQARDYGIHAGMPISEARELAEEAGEDIAFLGADKDYYSQVSEEVMDAVQEEVKDIEAASIDEAYGLVEEGYDEARGTAERIKDNVEEMELTSSVGIGPNKLIAKMASDRNKPDGLTVVKPDEVEEFLEGMDVEELHGIGPKTGEELDDMGIETVEELREARRQELVEKFGEKKGLSLHQKARGEGSKNLEKQEQEQLSRLTTLEENTRDLEDINPVLEQLSKEVMDRVEERGWRYSTVTVLFVTTDLDTRTRSTTFKTASGSRQRFQNTAEELAEQFLKEDPKVVVRRFGVRASGFDKSGQKSLGEF